MKDKQQIVITRGVPASGKTTFARKWVAENPDWRTRINRDDTRKMVTDKFWGLSRHQEETMTLLQLAMARAAIAAKLSVIVDDTNLRASTVRTWMDLADELGVEFVVEDIDIDVEEAVARDKARDRQVGEDVIRDFHKRFIQKGRFPALPERQDKVLKGKAYVPNPELPKAVWVDADGTFFSMYTDGVAHRGPFEWDKVHMDHPITAVVDAVKALQRDGYKIVVMSGRDEVCFQDTWDAFVKNGVTPDDLFMRPHLSQVKDSKIKHDLFWEKVAPKYDVRFALDDRDQVVEFTRDVLKIPVFQVAPGNF